MLSISQEQKKFFYEKVLSIRAPILKPDRERIRKVQMALS